MEFLFDTANLGDIETLSGIYPVTGATCNPTIIKAEGRIDFWEHFRKVRAALGRLRCARLFAGFRGRPAVDPGPFTRAVVRVGQLLADCPEIAELDLGQVEVRHLPAARDA